MIGDDAFDGDGGGDDGDGRRGALNPFSAEAVLIRQNLTSTDVKF